MENKKRNKVLDFLQGNMVPILFTVLCLASIKISGQNAGYVITETVSRVGRNAILIVSLILPVPVSYTHLDVYKRQITPCWRKPW